MTFRAAIIALAALACAAEAPAQWSAPSYMPPRPDEDIGIYVAAVDGLGIQGIWRQHGNLNLGVRVGYLESYGGVLVAAETWGPIFTAGVDFPVDVSWTLGAGAVFGSATAAEIPVGVSVGRSLMFQPVVVQVYGHPRIALLVGDDSEDTGVGGLFDLGADVMMARGLTLRLGTTLGTFNALGIGVALQWGRAVEVR